MSVVHFRCNVSSCLTDFTTVIFQVESLETIREQGEDFCFDYMATNRALGDGIVLSRESAYVTNDVVTSFESTVVNSVPVIVAATDDGQVLQVRIFPLSRSSSTYDKA